MKRLAQGHNTAPRVRIEPTTLRLRVRRKTKVWTVTRHFPQICNRVKALNRCSSIVFAAYLESKCKVANHVVSVIGFTDLQDQYSDITGKENRSYISYY